MQGEQNQASSRWLQRRGGCGASWILGTALLLAVSAITAQTASEWGQMHSGQKLGGTDFGEEAEGPVHEMHLRTLNAARQKSLVSDTEKLVKLAHELDAEIASDRGQSPTADQLRKVAQIEKLAHSVREKMSTSVRGIQVFRPLMFPQQQ